MKHPELVHGLELLPCAIRDGMLYIPHADGNWVSAAKLQPFSLKIIEYWRAEQVEASRSRAASEPGEVARLAEDAVSKMIDFAEDVWQAGKDGFRCDSIAPCRERRAAAESAIRRLASIATSPASEPGEVARLADKLKTWVDLNTSHEPSRVVLKEDIDRLARMATSPASEAQAGWVMVPREPTKEMRDIFCDVKNRTRTGCSWVASNADIDAAWRAMLASAPLPASSPAELPGMWEESDLSGGATDCLTASSPVAAEGQKAVAWKPTEAQILAAAEKAGLWPNTVHHWIAAFDRFFDALALATPTASMADAAEPIDMVLHCPACGLQHIDAEDPEPAPNYLVPLDEFERLNALHPFKTPADQLPEWRKQGSYYWHEHEGQMGVFFILPGQWHNPPHRSHLCHDCGHVWRPADVPTNGVAEVKTRGKADSATPGPRGENAGGVVEALSRAEVEDVDAEVMKSPRDYCFQFATAIQRACATAWGLRIAEKGDAS